MGRLVKTHSTYIDGLIPWLKALAMELGIKTITPGVIKKARRRCQGIKIRVSIETKDGYKLIARRGSSVQEVFVVTKLPKEVLTEFISKCNPN